MPLSSKFQMESRSSNSRYRSFITPRTQHGKSDSFEWGIGLRATTTNLRTFSCPRRYIGTSFGLATKTCLRTNSIPRTDAQLREHGDVSAPPSYWIVPALPSCLHYRIWPHGFEGISSNPPAIFGGQPGANGGSLFRKGPPAPHSPLPTPKEKDATM